MKLFLKRVFFFSIIIFFLIIIYEIFLSHVPNTYTVKEKLIEAKKDSIELLIVGTSRAFSGIIPNRMNKFSVNIANNSQSIYYDIGLLKKNIKKLPNLNTIIFDINFFTFEYNLDNGPEAWRALYYNNINNIYPQSKNLSFFDKLFINMYNPKDIIYHIGSISLYENYFQNYGVALSSEKISVVNKQNSFKRYNHLLNKYMLRSERDKIIKELEIFLESLINQKVKVFFVQIPISPTMYSYIDKKLLITNDNTLKDLQKKFPNIELINMLNDVRFSDNDFRDSDHLNSKGAIKFSEILNTKINSFHLD